MSHPVTIQWPIIITIFSINTRETEAPSTRIRIFLNPQLFLNFRIQKCPRLLVSVFKSSFPVHKYPIRIRIHSSTKNPLGILATEHAS